MKDYSASYIDLCQEQRKLYAAMNSREWGRVAEITDNIIVAAREIRAHSLHEVQRDTGRQGQKEGS